MNFEFFEKKNLLGDQRVKKNLSGDHRKPKTGQTVTLAKVSLAKVSVWTTPAYPQPQDNKTDKNILDESY